MSIIVAVDVNCHDAALRLAGRLEPQLCRLKVGKELFTCAGPNIVKALQQRGFDIFLDLKFHDIPNTTAQAVLAAADLGVWMVNVHASGGRKMLETCVTRLKVNGMSTLLIGVTVLTSLNDHDLQEVGIADDTADHVRRLAHLSAECGLDGVVCSAQEAIMLRQQLNKDFQLITPGIRPLDAAIDDQQRIVTPRQAVQNGATHLVIGRPITQSNNPAATLLNIYHDISSSC